MEAKSILWSVLCLEIFSTDNKIFFHFRVDIYLYCLTMDAICINTCWLRKILSLSPHYPLRIRRSFGCSWLSINGYTSVYRNSNCKKRVFETKFSKQTSICIYATSTYTFEELWFSLDKNNIKIRVNQIYRFNFPTRLAAHLLYIIKSISPAT